MKNWESLASKSVLEKTIKSLKKHNVDSIVVNGSQEAKATVLKLIPKNSEVMTMSSMTLEAIGIAKEIQESKDYNAVKNKLMKMDRETQGLEMQKLGSAPEYAIGSVHAVTQDGKLLIASQSGSQLPAYAYGANKVIWVVSTKKIVKNEREANERIYKHCLLLETKRAMKAYGRGSAVNKILVMDKEIKPGRLTVVFVKENLGF